MHAGWKEWLHGRTRTSWPFSKSSVHIEQPRAFSSLVSDVDASCEPVAPAAVISRDVSGSSAGVAASPLAGGASFFACACASVSSPSAEATDLVLASSTSVGLARSSSLSPNLTIGIVSNMALARPLALLCLGLPNTFRGPYRSGCLCARTAPVTMITRNNAVMTPVMLYRMIMATAVEGEPLELPRP